MKRRRLLGIAAGAVILTWPGWLARAFAQEDDVDETALLRAAIERGRATGRPVLVIVVPEAHDARWARGRAWGELLDHATDHTMAYLALAEVVCARVATLETLIPSTPREHALAYVVEPGGEVAAYDGALVVAVDGASVAQEAAIDARIGALSALLHRALVADDAMVARRAEAARSALGAATASLSAAITLGPAAVSLELAAEAPALVYAALGTATEAEAVAWDGLLAALAVSRLRWSDVPGSEWRMAALCRRCGMGYAPQRSMRFLDWLVGR